MQQLSNYMHRFTCHYVTSGSGLGLPRPRRPWHLSSLAAADSRGGGRSPPRLGPKKFIARPKNTHICKPPFACQNVLKLTYSNLEFQNFPGRTPDPTLQGEGREGREEREGKGKRRREGNDKQGRGGRGRDRGGREGRNGGGEGRGARCGLRP